MVDKDRRTRIIPPLKTDVTSHGLWAHHIEARPRIPVCIPPNSWSADLSDRRDRTLDKTRAVGEGTGGVEVRTARDRSDGRLCV